VFVEGALFLAAVVAVVLLFYNEVLFSGRTLITSGQAAGVMGIGRGPYGFDGTQRQDSYRVDAGASAWQMQPWTREVGQAFAAKTLPLWNSHQGFGAPLLAEPVSGALDPLRFPMWLSSSAWAWDIYFLLRTVLGLIATYLFARVVGLSFFARVFLAFAYVFSGHFIEYGNQTWVEGYYLFPLILLGMELLATRRWRVGFVLTAVDIALAINMGMPEASLLILTTAALYGVVRFLQLAVGDRNWSARVQNFARFVGAWTVGIALAAPQLVPLAEYAKNSSSLVGRRGQFGLGYESIRNVGLWFIPHLDGLTSQTLQAGSVTGAYVGTMVLVLAICGLMSVPTSIGRRLVPISAGISLLLLAKIFGLPVVNEIGRLPAFDTTDFPRSAGPIACFFLVLLASVGVHRLTTRDEHNSQFSGILVLVLFAATWLVLVLGILVDGAVIVHVPRIWEVFNIGLSLVLSAATCVLIYARGRWLHGGPMGAAICALLALELFAYAPHDTAYQDRHDPYVKPPYISFLLKEQSRRGPFRIFGLHGIMFPNIAGVFGLDDIRSLDPLDIDRYMLYVRNFLAPHVADRYVGGPWFSPEGSTRMVGNPWFDLTGVRYVLAPSGGDNSGVITHMLSRPSGSRIQHQSFAPKHEGAQYARIYNSEIQILENRDALPRAFFVKTIRPADGMASAIVEMRTSHIDPARVAVVEGIGRMQPKTFSASTTSVRLYYDAAHNSTIQVSTNRPEFLVLADAMYPGWEGTLDGRSEPVYPTDLAFRGMYVPSGRHVIRFVYRPASFRGGAIVALAALVVLLLVSAFRMRFPSSGVEEQPDMARNPREASSP
jgi:Bacterial membrane protein YfhO